MKQHFTKNEWVTAIESAEFLYDTCMQKAAVAPESMEFVEYRQLNWSINGDGSNSGSGMLHTI